MKLHVKFVQSVIEQGEPSDDSLTLYEKLHTKSGKKNTWRWFKKRCDEGSEVMDEGEAIVMFRMMTRRKDYEILDMIDLFGMIQLLRHKFHKDTVLILVDMKNDSTLCWKQFYLVMALYSSLASQQTVNFLHNHGEEMFRTLSGPSSSELDFQKFASFGWLLGIPEEELVQSLITDFKVNGDRLRDQPINMEDFMVYYFSVLKKLDYSGNVMQYSPQDLLKNSALCACTIS
eukprot:TRINITY_DN2544_c0_g1_i2.p1 TRINITY_DN2544_c0_g1~~TRINITY_DN2544_c0_g1_i2.p1  ORF type:complete len:231 (-),score=26.13 TRINITY_DN2544_c0_g1_i2:402-1094(-)